MRRENISNHQKKDIEFLEILFCKKQAANFKINIPNF